MEDNKDVEQTEEKEEQEGKEQEKVEQETTQKTYTEQDIQNSFNAGVKKASSEWQKDEKYKEFLDWKKKGQNNSEKINELTALNEQLTKENAILKATNEVAKSDVKPEFLKFVTSEVMNLVDDTTDFETALKLYKRDNPHFFGEIVVKKVQSSPNLNNGGTKEATTNNIMNDILRGAKNN